MDAYALVTELADKDPKVQVATLKMSLGEDALEVMETLPYSKPEDRRDLQATLTLLEKHFAGETNVTFERFLFLAVPAPKRVLHRISYRATGSCLVVRVCAAPGRLDTR